MSRFLFLYLLCLSGALAGEIRLTLPEIPGYAVRHNLALAAARQRIAEARGRLQQTGRLANPDLEVEARRNVKMAEGEVGLSLTQKFPVTARLRLEKAIGHAELAMAEAEVRNAERKVATDASLAAVKLLGLEGQRALRERQSANSRELAGFTRKRVESGEAAVVDASLVELEAQQLQVEMLALEVDRASVFGELRPLLGVSPGTALILTGELPSPGPLPRHSFSTSTRPDLVLAETGAAAARQAIALARAQKWSDVGVGLNVSEERTEDAPEGLRNDLFVGLRFSLQLPLWNDNGGRVREAEAAAARTAKELEALTLTARAETQEARSALATLAHLIAQLESELLPKAAQIEDQLRTSFSSGQAALPEVLRARDRRLLIERQRLDALRDYHLARIRHAAATGSILPSRTSAQ